MSDYLVGYKRPPVATRFKPGVSPNPRGRGAKKDFPGGKIFEEVVYAAVPITQGRKRTKMPRREALLRQCVARVVKGDIDAADLLMTIYWHSKKFGDYEPLIKAFPNRLAAVAAEYETLLGRYLRGT